MVPAVSAKVKSVALLFESTGTPEPNRRNIVYCRLEVGSAPNPVPSLNKDPAGNVAGPAASISVAALKFADKAVLNNASPAVSTTSTPQPMSPSAPRKVDAGFDFPG